MKTNKNERQNLISDHTISQVRRSTSQSFRRVESSESMDLEKHVALRKNLIEKFFRLVPFKFEQVFEYIKSNKKHCFREVEYESLLRILNLQNKYL